MKNKDTQKYLVIVVAAMLLTAGGMYFAFGGGSASTIDSNAIVNDDGELVGPWTSKIVNFNLITSDLYTGADVASTAKVYDEQPSEWLNARGDFNEAELYTTYTASSGTISVNKETPGLYYVVLTASGYNTEFMTITIPDGTGRDDISDYQSNPDSIAAEMSAVGTTTTAALSLL